MKLNIPKSTTVSHELPIFTELSRDSGLPVSEIKARFRKEMLENINWWMVGALAITVLLTLAAALLKT